MNSDYVVDLRELTANDVARVGGKNASLGEMVRSLRPAGVNIPPGFATTANAYWNFLQVNHLKESIEAALAGLKTEKQSLQTVSKTIRGLFARAEFPPELASPITDAYARLCAEVGRADADVAVRSSATAEDGLRQPMERKYPSEIVTGGLLDQQVVVVEVGRITQGPKLTARDGIWQ